ncbi:hypothetical protein EBB07_12560 [Paenibacillaceae bacterium]|nr:hypothetical protein EBB07_12560 [Paenibacillaceae bacterium]
MNEAPGRALFCIGIHKLFALACTTPRNLSRLPCYLTLPRLTSPYLASPHLTSPHLTLPRLTLPYLVTSPYFTLPCYLTLYMYFACIP